MCRASLTKLFRKNVAPLPPGEIEKSKPKYGITGKAGGLKSTPNHDKEGRISSWTITFVILGAKPLPNQPPIPDPLPQDVPVWINLSYDPVRFDNYQVEADGYLSSSGYFLPVQVRIPRLNLILEPTKIPWWFLIVVLLIFGAVAAWIVFGIKNS